MMKWKENFVRPLIYLFLIAFLYDIISVSRNIEAIVSSAIGSNEFLLWFQYHRNKPAKSDIVVCLFHKHVILCNFLKKIWF